MKKLFLFGVVICAVLPSVATEKGVQERTYRNHFEDACYVYEKEVPDLDKDLLEIEVLKEELPESINLLIDSEWKVTVEEQSYLDERIGQNFVIGLTSSKKHEILIAEGRSFEAYYHEVGHATDLSLGRLSSSDEFKKIMQQEMDNIKDLPCVYTWYAKTNEMEFFAEMFACYIRFPDQLETSCPKVYFYFKDTVFSEVENFI